MNWKKELTSWGLILAFFAFLYLSGLLPVIQGAIQSVFLSTGLVKPNLEQTDRVGEQLDYSGILRDQAGKPVPLEQFKGKTLFINSWASWCGPCRAEMPHIADLYASVETENKLEFLMISVDKDFEKSQDFLAGKSWRFPVYHAANGLNPSLQSSAIPTTLVVDSTGTIVFYQEGMSNFNTDAFREFLINL